jgi:hypothetical protein
MNIPQLGPLRPHPHSPGDFLSEPVSVPYFDDRPVKFWLAELTEADEQDVTSAVGAFLALDSAARLAASPYLFQNYQQIGDAVGEDQMWCHIGIPEAIWEHVQPNYIRVARRPRRDQLIYIVIDAECDWDPEHGLQIVYRRGSELARVSDQSDGELTYADAYDLPEDQDKIV